MLASNSVISALRVSSAPRPWRCFGLMGWSQHHTGVAVALLALGACTADDPGAVAPVLQSGLHTEMSAQTKTIHALTDREILEIFYRATGGPDWYYQGGWMSESSIEHWEGVSVDATGRVRALSQVGNDLSGSIPPELGSLSNLERLDLSENRLTGSIPAELGSLDSLEVLDLSNNRLAGSIPSELGSLGNLEELEFSFNQLTGSIPPELANLSSLSWLSLYRNQLTGSIPPELGDMDSLLELGLEDLRLTSVPPELGNLDDLLVLDLSGNNLAGIPSELGDLANLQFFTLAHNDLTDIPPELASIDSLRYLLLNDNEITGSIPPALGDLSTLQDLSLSGNQLTGAIPPELGKLGNLRTLELQDNRLTGSIPPELGDLEVLEVLWLDDNDLSGAISAEFVRSAFLHDWSSDRYPLTYLFADNNRFAGPAPAALDSLSFYEVESYISLAGNELTGSVPLLPAGDVRRNYFSGCIPATWRLFGTLPHLRVNPQRTSTGGTVNLKECYSRDGVAAVADVTGQAGDALRANLRVDLEESRERALVELAQRNQLVANPRSLAAMSWGEPSGLRPRWKIGAGKPRKHPAPGA